MTYCKHEQLGAVEGWVTYNTFADSYIVVIRKEGKCTTLAPTYGNGVIAYDRLIDVLLSEGV
jgi:hypothetical protein